MQITERARRVYASALVNNSVINRINRGETSALAEFKGHVAGEHAGMFTLLMNGLGRSRSFASPEPDFGLAQDIAATKILTAPSIIDYSSIPTETLLDAYRGAVVRLIDKDKGVPILLAIGRVILPKLDPRDKWSVKRSWLDLIPSLQAQDPRFAASLLTTINNVLSEDRAGYIHIKIPDMTSLLQAPLLSGDSQMTPQPLTTVATQVRRMREERVPMEIELADGQTITWEKLNGMSDEDAARIFQSLLEYRTASEVSVALGMSHSAVAGGLLRLREEGITVIVQDVPQQVVNAANTLDIDRAGVKLVDLQAKIKVELLDLLNQPGMNVARIAKKFNVPAQNIWRYVDMCGIQVAGHNPSAESRRAHQE